MRYPQHNSPGFFTFLCKEKTKRPSEEPTLFLSNLALTIGRQIKEGSLDFEVLKKALQDCQTFYPEHADFVNTLEIGIEYPQAQSIPLSLQLLLRMEISPQIFKEGKMGRAFEGIPFRSAKRAVEFLENVIRENEVPLIRLQGAGRLSPFFLALEEIQKGVFGSDLTPLRTQAARIAFLMSLLQEDTLLAAARWAASINCHPLLNECSSVYCKEGKLKKFKGFNEIELFSIQSKPLEFLKAIGQNIRYLTLFTQTDPHVAEGAWSKIVQACPRLHFLSLYISGKAPPLETFALSELPELQHLLIALKDMESWEAVRSLKIPPTLSKICILTDMTHIERTTPYEFFDRLPPTGVTLELKRSTPQQPPRRHFSQNLLEAPVEMHPTKIRFPRLRQCTELSIRLLKCDCMGELISTISEIDS